jgi:hypothetical protein
MLHAVGAKRLGVALAAVKITTDFTRSCPEAPSALIDCATTLLRYRQTVKATRLSSCRHTSTLRCTVLTGPNGRNVSDCQMLFNS